MVGYLVEHLNIQLEGQLVEELEDCLKKRLGKRLEGHLVEELVEHLKENLEKQLKLTVQEQKNPVVIWMLEDSSLG